MIVFSVGTYAVNSIILGWVASTCGQTKEKKATSLAIVNMFANLSFVWTAVRRPPSPIYHNVPFANGWNFPVPVAQLGRAALRCRHVVECCILDRVCGHRLVGQVDVGSPESAHSAAG